ncbi:MAG: CHAT domain-containing tetratricopeptide repeat protein [Devosia sp.]
MRQLLICLSIVSICLFGGLAVTQAMEGVAETIAQQTAEIEAALRDKKPVEAEVLARDALAFAESMGPETLEVANLSRLFGDALFYQSRIVEAEPYYRKALTLREKLLDPNSLDIAISANDLGIILKRQNKFVEAEPYYRQVIAIREAAQGHDHADTARAVFWLSRNLDANAQYAEAAAAMADAVARATVALGPNDPTTVEWLGEYAAMLHDSGDYAAALPAYLDAITMGEAVLDIDSVPLSNMRQGLANLYMTSERPVDAVPLYRAALAAREASLGADDASTVSSMDRLARALWAVEDVAEAEGLFRRVLAAREKSDGARSPAVADMLRWMGRAATAQDRLAEAEIVLKRALDISQGSGPEDVLTGFDLIALGQLYSGQQRFVEARPLLQRAVAIFESAEDGRRLAAVGRMALSFLEYATGNSGEAERLARASLEDMSAIEGADSRDAADIMLSLGSYRTDAGDLAEAERLVSAAREIYRFKAPDSRSLVRSTSELGRIRQKQGRLDDALVLHREALATLTARYGENNSETQSSLSDIASTLFALGDYAGAASYFEQSTAIIERLAAVDSEAAFMSRTGDIEDQAIARGAVFDFLVKAYYRQSEGNGEDVGSLAQKAFIVAQRVIESEAAGALAQMASRQSAGDGELAGLVRERQDLVAQWQREDSALTLALATSAADQDAAKIEVLRAALASSDGRIVEIDSKLSTAYPDFAQLQRPHPLSVEAVQARLDENEVLLFFADTGKLGDAGFETYLWAVPKAGEVRWIKLSRSPGELSAAVRALRKSMHVGTETRGPTALTAESGDSADAVLAAASQLDSVMLGGVADLIEGRELVIIPSKSLAALPFHALVSALPSSTSTDRYRDARWLARDHAITILPSVTSLAGTTSLASAEQARVPYLAFANPLLTGRDGSDRRAFNREGCAPVDAGATIAEAVIPPLADLFRGGSADLVAVRALPPLPETSDEVCGIAEALGAAPDALQLGADATETNLKALSASGQLMLPRVVHFATHGLVSGDLSGLAEPAIVLTPPAAIETDDDGLLTASEVATLKLDADWVILSACNTASSDGGGEALSGLARAFFYAGAKALMVSHWPVNSNAAVALATGAVGALTKDPTIGKAEALRRAMVAEIELGGAHADPANWAPFILVGASR